MWCVNFLEDQQGQLVPIFFFEVAKSIMRCRKSTRRINRREDRRLPFFNPFLMGNQLPCESLIVIVEVDVLMIFDSQEVKLDPKPLFSEKVNKKFHDMESNGL